MPIVERVAGWSARHKKTAVFGWLLLVVACLLVGQRLGTSNVNSYDPGQAGTAERVLNESIVQQPDSESVLIQAPAGHSFASDASLRLAVRDVVTALHGVPRSATDIQSPFTSQGRHLHERSFSARDGALVLMGWPVSSLLSAGRRRPLDELRRSMTDAGILHRYHAAPADVDDDFHLVVGHYAGATPQAVTAAVVAVRRELAGSQIEIEVGLDQVRIIAAQSPTLSAPWFNHALPLAASQIASLYGAGVRSESCSR